MPSAQISVSASRGSKRCRSRPVRAAEAADQLQEQPPDEADIERLARDAQRPVRRERYGARPPTHDDLIVEWLLLAIDDPSGAELARAALRNGPCDRDAVQAGREGHGAGPPFAWFDPRGERIADADLGGPRRRRHVQGLRPLRRHTPETLPRHRKRQRVPVGVVLAIEVETFLVVEERQRHVGLIVDAEAEPMIGPREGLVCRLGAQLDRSCEVGVGVVARRKAVRNEDGESNDNLQGERDCRA